MDEPSCSSTSQTECIIHNKSCNIEKNEKLTTPQSLNSWKTLLEAATTRNHIHLLSIAAKTNEGEVPNISYHTKCRNLFTLKRDLQNIKQKMEQDPRQSPSEMPSKHHKRVIPPKNRRVYQKVCIFCEKEKRQKDQSREKLVLTTQLRVDKSLRRCATIRGDEKILAITARDIVAAEAHYHRSCYRTYTWQTPKVKKVDSDKDDYAEIEKEAMKELYNFIRSTIIPLKQIVPLTYIAKKLEEIMNNKGVVQIKESSKTHIRRKLDDNMSTSLILISDDDGKVVVVPHTVTLEMVVKENRSLQKAIKLLNKNTKDNETILDQASTILRTTINQDKKIESHNLPPCKDCLNKHAQRANYQTSLWKTSLVNTEIPSPLGMGWKLGGQNEENELEIDWMDGQPAPKAVLDLLACNCSTSCKLNNCSCKKNGLKCTKMCKKKNCKNQARDNHLQELNINDESLENDEFPGFSEFDFCGF